MPKKNWTIQFDNVNKERFHTIINSFKKKGTADEIISNTNLESVTLALFAVKREGEYSDNMRVSIIYENLEAFLKFI